MTATSLMLRKQLWIWPIIAAVLLGICGWWVSRSVEDAMRQRRINELSTILDADLAALDVWMSEQAKDAELIAKDEQLLLLAHELLTIAKSGDDSSRELTQS